MDSSKNEVILMLKYPEPGKVKTRLGEEIGHKKATRIYRNMVELILRRVGFGINICVAYSPRDREEAMRLWLDPLLGKGARYEPQCEGDLGTRLKAAFGNAFERGAERVIALGGDCIEINSHEIESAFDELRAHSLIVGPSTDGGYWLIGMSENHPLIFEAMPWSTPELMDATRRRAEEIGIRLFELETKSDIDCREDLMKLDPATLSELDRDESGA